MSFSCFGGPAHGNFYQRAFWSDRGGAEDVILTSAAASGDLPGTYCYEFDPVNGEPAFERYGFGAKMTDTDKFSMMFNFEFDQDATPDYWDANVVLASVGSGTASTARMRKLLIDINQKLGLFDKDDDEVGTASNVLVKDNAYALIYYHDHTGTSRDIVWLRDISGGDANVSNNDWTKVIDVTGHGDTAGSLGVFAIGSWTGKSLPTTGGKIYVSFPALQDLTTQPNAAALGSIKTFYRAANANGADDLDFNTGVGASHPSYLNVDDTPANSDEASTYDEGDVNGDRQGYAVVNATSGHNVLSVIPYAVAKKASVADATIKLGVYDGTNYKFQSAYNATGGWNSGITTGVIAIETVNSVPLSESLFNDLEVIMEITALSAGAKVQWTMAGLEYAIEGDYPVPDDHPAIPSGVGRSYGYIFGCFLLLLINRLG